jgi:UDPglucose 6-dehydrogenase
VNKGHDVTVYDPDTARINEFSNSRPPFYEPGLKENLERHLKNRTLSFRSVLGPDEDDYEAAFVCTGTPSAANGEAELKYVAKALKDSMSVLRKNSNVFIRSSCPPGSFEELMSTIGDELIEKLINVCVYPEFLREGSAISDMENPDRIVIGTRKFLKPELLYEIFHSDSHLISQVTPWDAAMIKYANNGLLATLISFSNALSEACENSPEGDFSRVLDGLLSDRRWKVDSTDQKPGITSYLWPGIGFGGSCLPKDVLALANSKVLPELTKAFFQNVISTNTNRIHGVINFIESISPKDSNNNFLVAGVAFKEGTDDLRNSQSLILMEELAKKNKVSWCDSHVLSNLDLSQVTRTEHFSDSFLSTYYDLIILTNHDSQLNSRCVELSNQMGIPIVLMRNQEIDPCKITPFKIGSGEIS